MEFNKLKQKQSLPLKGKIILSKRRIKEWYEAFDGKVYVSFSGGKDSTVLLHLVRSLYPDVKALFLDTGLEYPEIKTFVKTIPNVIWLKPNMPFTKVIEKYGYPVVSKAQSQYIYQYRNAKSEKTKKTRWEGGKNGIGKISEKWKYLVNADFKISDKCCDILKKNPAKKFEKETGLKPIIGTMADDSMGREFYYKKNGCNSFNSTRQISKPLSIWLESDIWDYIKLMNIPYSDIYNLGYTNTGCMFCAYGVQHDTTNRFLLMEKTHNKIYEYCMNKLNLKHVLKTLKMPYKNRPKIFK